MSLYQEVAGIAIAELMSAAEGTLPNDRYEDALHYAEEAFEVMNGELEGIDPETDPPMARSKRAAIIYVKRHLTGQEGSLSDAFRVALNRYARSAMQHMNKIKQRNGELVDENARLDMFRL